MTDTHCHTHNEPYDQYGRCMKCWEEAAQSAAKATARRTAARKGAATRSRRRG